MIFKCVGCGALFNAMVLLEEHSSSCQNVRAGIKHEKHEPRTRAMQNPLVQRVPGHDREKRKTVSSDDAYQPRGTIDGKALKLRFYEHLLSSLMENEQWKSYNEMAKDFGISRTCAFDIAYYHFKRRYHDHVNYQHVTREVHLKHRQRSDQCVLQEKFIVKYLDDAIADKEEMLPKIKAMKQRFQLASVSMIRNTFRKWRLMHMDDPRVRCYVENYRCVDNKKESTCRSETNENNDRIFEEILFRERQDGVPALQEND